MSILDRRWRALWLCSPCSLWGGDQLTGRMTGINHRAAIPRSGPGAFWPGSGAPPRAGGLAKQSEIGANGAAGGALAGVARRRGRPRSRAARLAVPLLALPACRFFALSFFAILVLGSAWLCGPAGCEEPAHLLRRTRRCDIRGRTGRCRRTVPPLRTIAAWGRSLGRQIAGTCHCQCRRPDPRGKRLRHYGHRQEGDAPAARQAQIIRFFLRLIDDGRRLAPGCPP